MSSQVDDAHSFNLEHYFSKLTLHPIIHDANAPPMPPPQTRSSLVPLTVKPAGYRSLREMHRVDMTKKIISYFSKLEYLEEDTFRSLRVLLEHDAGIPPDFAFSPYIINNAPSMENLLYRFLFPIQAILRTMDPNICDWSFQTVPRLRSNLSDTQSRDPIFFCIPRQVVGYKPTSVKLIILNFCPWEFTPQDFIEFSTIGRFEDMVSNEWQSRDWVNADKLWAHLYDLCLDSQCPFFAITSYEQWIFGGFSKHYTSGWFSPTLSFDNKPISIIEMIVYWIHTSFNKKDTFIPPNIHSERKLTDAHLTQELQSHSERYLDIERLEKEILRDAPPLDKEPRTDSDTEEDMHPAKRRRTHSPERPKFQYPRFIPENWEQFPMNPEKMQSEVDEALESADGVSLGSSDTPSDIPSSADPLPEDKIPRKKNTLCERWRELVALGEDGTIRPHNFNEVIMQMYDPDTGVETEEFVNVDDHTCASCLAPSESMSDCSLSEEELAMWKTPHPKEEDFPPFIMCHWGL